MFVIVGNREHGAILLICVVIAVVCQVTPHVTSHALSVHAAPKTQLAIIRTRLALAMSRSFISAQDLYWIDIRLKRAKGKPDLPFGGMT